MRAFDWCQNQRPWMAITHRASFRAHHENLNEDRLHCQRRPGAYLGGGLAPAPPPLKVKKLTSADFMNIIMAVIGLVGLKRAPECIKMHQFEGENAKNFLGRGHSPFSHF